MTVAPQNTNDCSQAITNQDIEDEPILCPHCKRTASNGIKCKGMYVADSDH